MAKKETMSDENVLEVFRMKEATKLERIRKSWNALFFSVFIICGTVLAIVLVNSFVGQPVIMSGNFDCTTGDLGLQAEFTNPYFSNSTVNIMKEDDGWFVWHYASPETKWQGKYIKIDGVNGMRCSGSGTIKAPVWMIGAMQK